MNLMKELQYLKVINKALSDSSYLGDDCAFLSPELLGNNGLYVTQDSLVEDIHFSLSTTTPYQLGKKSINVNISDLAAALAKPLFVTISLSLPKNICEDFVKEFYRGVNDVCENYGVKVVGGDLTGSDKVFLSICAIGKKIVPFETSRSSAKEGDIIVTTGFHGDSAGGLKLLSDGLAAPKSLIDSHLDPIAKTEKSEILAQFVNSDFAMMDTSDGLGDALYKIASQSNVSMAVEFEKVPISDELKQTFPNNFKSLALWGGEDYELLFCVSKDVFSKLDKSKFFEIGIVEKLENSSFVKIKDGENIWIIDEMTFHQKSFNHFKEEIE